MFYIGLSGYGSWDPPDYAAVTNSQISVLEITSLFLTCTVYGLWVGCGRLLYSTVQVEGAASLMVIAAFVAEGKTVMVEPCDDS